MRNICTIHFHYGTFAREKFYYHNKHIRIKSLDIYPELKPLEWMNTFNTYEEAVKCIDTRYVNTNCSIEWAKSAKLIVV